MAKFLAGGSTFNGSNYDFAVVRYLNDGSLDLSFDTDGKVSTDNGGSNDRGYSMALQNNGKIIVAGSSQNSANEDFGLVRYNTDGTLDLSFDLDGKVTTAIGTGDDIGRALAIQSDGKILLTGTSISTTYDDIAVARYSNSIPTVIEAFNATQSMFFAYPNPFTNTTTILFDSPLNNGELSIYNILGEKVKMIKNISGQHVILNREYLSAGQYFITLTEGNKIISKGRVLIKD